MSSSRGTIVRKPNGRYYVATHKRDADGKRRQVWHGGFRTKREAQHRLTEVLRHLDEGTFIARDEVTFGAFLRSEWLPTQATKGIRETTLLHYSYGVERAVRLLGHIKLQDLA